MVKDTTTRWQYGETLIARNIARTDGTVTTAMPCSVIQDDENLLAVFIATGTMFKDNWVVPPERRVEYYDAVTPSAQRQHQDLMYRNDAIRLYLPSRAYSVHLFFDEHSRFASWYGNLEAPFIRTPIGIDTRDYALDLVADCDGQWRWKDEAEFERRLDLGIDSAEHQLRVRSAGRDFIDCLEQRRWPFDQGWENWRPPQRWSSRSLPQNWAKDFGTHKLLSSATW